MKQYLMPAIVALVVVGIVGNSAILSGILTPATPKLP